MLKRPMYFGRDLVALCGMRSDIFEVVAPKAQRSAGFGDTFDETVLLGLSGRDTMLTGKLEECSTFPLTLSFENAGDITVEVPVLATQHIVVSQECGHSCEQASGALAMTARARSVKSIAINASSCRMWKTSGQKSLVPGRLFFAR